MSEPNREHVEAVTEAVSARLHITTDTWAAGFMPAISADTTSAQQAAIGVLTSTDPAVLDAMQDALVRAGRLREDWAHKNASGGGSGHRTRAEAEAARYDWEIRCANADPFAPPPPPSTGIRSRFVTEWQEVE